MKIVIDISENDYWLACNYPETLISVYAQAIKNGTPLPIPQKKEVHTDFIGVGDYDFDDIYNAGYNDCIDEILGGEEE